MESETIVRGGTTECRVNITRGWGRASGVHSAPLASMLTPAEQSSPEEDKGTNSVPGRGNSICNGLELELFEGHRKWPHVAECRQ